MDSKRLKPRIATAWLGGCSGCHMSFLDLDERLIELAGRVELCASPIADRKDFPSVDVALVEGAVASEEHVEHLRLIRRQATYLVAFGDCAVTGNVTALRNLFQLDDVLQRAYQETAMPSKGIPDGRDGIIPRLLPRVVPLHEIVHVDHFLQGCPPSADEIWAMVAALLEGRAPDAVRRFG